MTGLVAGQPLEVSVGVVTIYANGLDQTHDGIRSLPCAKVAYVKSILFGFKGWDRYILVEDESAKLVIQHHIDKHCLPTYYRHLIIEVGGVGQVMSLLERNRILGFLAPADAVIAILDGDQAGEGHANGVDAYCMPLWSLESAFEAAYEKPTFTPKLPDTVQASLPVKGRPKALHKAYRRYRYKSDIEIVELSCAPQAIAIQKFSEAVLSPFLSTHPAPLVLAPELPSSPEA